MKISQIINNQQFSDFFKAKIRYFQFSYQIHTITYIFFPGIPVSKNVEIQTFDKGQRKKAIQEFQAVIKSLDRLGISLAEVKLIRGKRTVIKYHQIGDVERLKGLPMVTNS
jgi:hypothetical protein